MTTYELTVEAMKTMSIEQHASLLDMSGNESVTKIVVQRGGFDLPVDYLTFRRDFKDGVSIYGGISPDGRIST